MRVIGIALVVVMATTTGDGVGQWWTVAHAQADVCRATTSQGDVRGIDRGQSCEYRAVPFGASTAGARRWMASFGRLFGK